MTREEAIIYLKQADVTVGRDIKTKTAEALEMAIKALEHPERNVVAVVPCGDAISRAEAIDTIRQLYLDLATQKAVIDLLKILPSVTAQSCEDAISRQAVLDLIADYDLSMGEVVKGIHALPSVIPQETKAGKWISTETKGVRYAFWCRYKCSLCGGLSDRTNFCPNCGAKMVEPQESESDA